MKIFFTYIVTIFLSSVSISVAQEKPPLIGTGSAQCSTMIDFIDKQNLNKDVYEQWVFGFMSSLALVHSQPVFDLSKPEEIWLAVETICKKNPEQHVFEAASVVYLQLLKMLSKTMKCSILPLATIIPSSLTLISVNVSEIGSELFL